MLSFCQKILNPSWHETELVVINYIGLQTTNTIENRDREVENVPFLTSFISRWFLTAETSGNKRVKPGENWTSIVHISVVYLMHYRSSFWHVIFFSRQVVPNNPTKASQLQNIILLWNQEWENGEYPFHSGKEKKKVQRGKAAFWFYYVIYWTDSSDCANL